MIPPIRSPGVKKCATSVELAVEQYNNLRKLGWNCQEVFATGVETLLEKGQRTGPIKWYKKGADFKHCAVKYDYDKLLQLQNYGYTYREAFQTGYDLLTRAGKPKAVLMAAQARAILDLKNAGGEV